MFNLKISMARFDSDGTFRALWPQVKQKIDTMASDNFWVLLLRQAGDTALTMLLRTLHRMESAQRNALFCRVVEICQPRIHSAAEAALRREGLGEAVSFSRLRLLAEGAEDLALYAEGIQVDFDQLVKHQRVVRALGGKAFLLKMAMPMLSLSQREKILVGAVRQSKYKDAILSYGNGLLSDAGIQLAISDLEIAGGEESDGGYPAKENQPLLSGELSNALIDAFSSYLLEALH